MTEIETLQTSRKRSWKGKKMVDDEVDSPMPFSTLKQDLFEKGGHEEDVHDVLGIVECEAFFAKDDLFSPKEPRVVQRRRKINHDGEILTHLNADRDMSQPGAKNLLIQPNTFSRVCCLGEVYDMLVIDKLEGGEGQDFAMLSTIREHVSEQDRRAILGSILKTYAFPERTSASLKGCFTTKQDSVLLQSSDHKAVDVIAALYWICFLVNNTMPLTLGTFEVHSLCATEGCINPRHFMHVTKREPKRQRVEDWRDLFPNWNLK